MASIPELDQIERRTWQRYSESGLTDIFMGAILLGSSVAAIMLRGDLPAPWPLVVYFALVVPFLVIFHGINHYVILPRQGRIRPGTSATSRRRKATIAGFASVGVTALLVILTVGIRGRGFEGTPSEVSVVRVVAPLVMTASILLFFGLTAYFLDYTRMYLIGILYAIGVGGIMLYVIEGIQAAIAATIGAVAFILVMGTIILIRWIRSHPVPITTEGLDEG
jgi:MFS family permease